MKKERTCYCCRRKTTSFYRFPESGQLRPYCNKCYLDYNAKERETRATQYLTEILMEEAQKVKK